MEEVKSAPITGDSIKPHKNLVVEVLPIVPDCPINEHSRIQVIDGVQVDRDDSIGFQVSQAEQCAQSCRMSMYPDGSRLPLLCRSAQFDRNNQKCSLFSDSINPNGFLEYQPNQHVIYMEKICIPDNVLPITCDDVFRRIPQHILLGHATDVISVSSEQECILECIKSKTMRSKTCHSILHYPDFPSLNCILNVHTRHTKQQYFIPELSFKVDYVEIAKCVTETAIGADSESIGVGSVLSEWSEWSTCDDETSTRSRQRHCNGCKEMIQFMPCFSNNKFDVALQQFILEQQNKEMLKESELSPQEDAANVQQVIKFPQNTATLSNSMVSNKSVEFFGPPQELAKQSEKQELPRKPIRAMSSF
ncbi:unnamed protein product [Caenorhabditis bovis]|uniref:Apple domain-containing protein n=1 Tax=Caenorhabditis bovis TaxID=2654633 RepID=A0A8S1ES24_9PELO|nr:unnamed protein product [Caenorhabditis bovis]